MRPQTPSRTVRFEDFVLDVAACELRRRGRSVKVERRPMDLLMLLVERRGELVTREEIVDRLWGPDVFIDVDTSVNTVIHKVRRALRDSADRPRFIQTVQGRGYRFIAGIDAMAAPAVLAVLPFETLQDDREQDYVAHGITEETILCLARIDPSRLTVIGRTSSAAYRRTEKTVLEIGGELNADYLVDGSVRGERGLIRITARLIRVRDQVQVWTESYDRASDNLLGLQTELGRGIAEQIHLRLSPDRASAIAGMQTQNAAAYDLYLRGRYYYNQMTPATVARALDCFRQATAVDPTYALAWAGIGDAYSSRLFSTDTKPSDVAGHARDAAAHAISTGDTVAEAHTALARVKFLFDWDWPGAETHLRRALALDPSSAQSWWLLGHALSHQGRHHAALAAAERARALEPLDALSHSMSSQIAFNACQFYAAAEHASAALNAEPDFWVAHWQLAQAHERTGQQEAALEALAEASRLSNGNSKPLSLTAYTLATIGRFGEARDALAILEERSRQRYVPPVTLALARAALVEDDAAIEYLEEALAVRDVHLIYLPWDPKWDRLRTDRRFQELMNRCGFKEERSAT